MQEPVVSICCLVYNHEPFLRECFEGFVMQKTTFPIEILVHDDASTDHSADIIREYTAKYPDLFKPIYQTENQYSKGVKVSATFQFPRAKGKYIALCEGDDYWTDPYKLQKQVDFLESHPEYVMCSHRYKIYKHDLAKFDGEYPMLPIVKQTYDLHTYISGEKWVTQLLSVVFRTNAINIAKYSQYDNAKDAALFYHILTKGKGYLFKDIMGIYRHNIGGVWSSIGRTRQIVSEVKARLGICKVEQSKTSAQYLYNYYVSIGYLGVTFFLKQTRIYVKSLSIIRCYLGFRKMLNIFGASLNFVRWQ